MRKAGLPRKLRGTSCQPSRRAQRAAPTPSPPCCFVFTSLAKSGDRERELCTVTLGLGFILCPKTSSQTLLFLALSFCYNEDILNK